MNRHIHHLVFNLAQGCLVAVAESAHSRGKLGAGGTTRGSRRHCRTPSSPVALASNDPLAPVEYAQEAIKSIVERAANYTSDEQRYKVKDIRMQALAGEEAADITIAAGDSTVLARNIKITETQTSNASQTEQKFRQSGITLEVTSPVLSAIQTVQQMSQAAGNTKDARMKGLALANSAFAANNAKDAIQAGQGTTINGKEGQIATQVDDSGKVLASRDASAADKVGGINLAVSIGASSSQSNSSSQSDSARGSSVKAGNNVSITATGAGQASDLTVQGSSVEAGRSVQLLADNQVLLLAAQNTASQKSTNTNSSGSIGISYGTDGLLVNVSASGGRGKADGSDVSQSNTRIKAGEQVAITSGGDTTLQGAVVQAHQVKADIGGKLKIESLQDTSRYASKQQSLGGSLSVGVGKMSGSVSASRSNVDSNFASVVEQSGIRAGDGGFQVKVKGNTELKGGVIASTDKAVNEGKNSFQTGGALTASDIQNSASYSANSAGISVGGGASAKTAGVSGVGVGLGSDKGNANSTTKSGISGIAANTAVRSTDAQTGIARIFDADKVQKDINAQVQITQVFGQQASKAIGDYAAGKTREAAALRDQAGKESDPERIRELKAQAQTLEDNWGDQGTLRLAAHTLVGGLTGGMGGAAGAGVGTLTAPAVANALKDAGIDGALAQTLTAIASTTAGLVVGGTAGAAAAGNEVVNNYLTHTQELQRDKELTACKTLACSASVKLKYAGTSVMQDAGLVIGVGGGIGYQSVEQAAAIVELVKNLPETLTALSAIVSDPEFRAKVGNQIADDYQQRIDMQTKAYNEGGWDGSITAGVEAGRLAVDIVSVGTAAVGTTKLVATTARAGAGLISGAIAQSSQATTRFIADMALKGVQVGAIQGFKNAEEVNSLMNVYSYAPAWKTGTTVAETTITPGTRVQMVVDAADYKELLKGESRFGGWATFDNVPSQSYARNQLAITEGFKKDVGYVIEVEITKPIQAQVGVVGSQGGTSGGGGNQLNFLIDKSDRGDVFKVISGRKLP